MRFFTATLIALSTLAAAVFAQQNPITYPTGSDTLDAGKTDVIKWTPTTGSTDKITLVLRSGKSTDLGTVETICGE